MRKSVAFLLVLMILLSLCACENELPNSSSAMQSSTSLQSANSSTALQSEYVSSSTQSADSSSATKTPAKNLGETINITEKMFVTYINEIYTNTSDYIGKSVKIEGKFTAEYYEETNTTYYYVYRTGPGCCGNDGSMCGFEFTYNGEMPKENDWIEVVGTLRTYEESGTSYITLDAQSVTIKTERGAETVYN